MFKYQNTKGYLNGENNGTLQGKKRLLRTSEFQIKKCNCIGVDERKLMTNVYILKDMKVGKTRKYKFTVENICCILTKNKKNWVDG